MLPKHLRYAAEERAAMALQEHPVVTEESNSNSQDKWGDFYMNDDEYAMADPGSEPESDSDFEYEGRGAKRGKGRKSAMKTKPSRSSRSSRRMEEEAMSPVSDRKFNSQVQVIPSSAVRQSKCYRFPASIEKRYARQPGSLHAQPAPRHDAHPRDGDAQTDAGPPRPSGHDACRAPRSPGPPWTPRSPWTPWTPRHDAGSSPRSSRPQWSLPAASLPAHTACSSKAGPACAQGIILKLRDLAPCMKTSSPECFKIFAHE